MERCTLMRKNVEVVEFAWDPTTESVGRGAKVLNEKSLPFGCLDNTGAFARARLRNWLSDRSIPLSRPGIRKRLRELEAESPMELLSSSLGLGLSDQYWLKPKGFEGTWEEVNFFDNPFSDTLGELLLPHDPDRVPALLDSLKRTPGSLGKSPDAALNGNLPKRWELDGESRNLVKAGRPDNRFQEPFNEFLVTELCERLLLASDYVPYTLRVEGYLKYYSACPCMVDSNTEFVPAIQLYGSYQRRNDEDLGAFYARVCREHGLDVEAAIEKMIVVDYIAANFDRHWNNFGILMDSDSRTFLKAAPIFDTGESFWCDKEKPPFVGYAMSQQDAYRPFMRKLDLQLERYGKDLAWFDGDALFGFTDCIAAALEMNPLVKNDEGRIEAICAAVEKRIADVGKLAAKRSLSFSVSGIADSENIKATRHQ